MEPPPKAFSLAWSSYQLVPWLRYLPKAFPLGCGFHIAPELDSEGKRHGRS